jgi:hypothetical protein
MQGVLWSHAWKLSVMSHGRQNPNVWHVETDGMTA